MSSHVTKSRVALPNWESDHLLNAFQKSTNDWFVSLTLVSNKVPKKLEFDHKVNPYIKPQMTMIWDALRMRIH